MSAPRIQEHAAIGDGRSIALVTKGGAIDWLCWPRPDSGAVFAELLDARAGGWTLAPTEPARTQRAYLAGSNVLVTRFETSGGVLAVMDSMSVASTSIPASAPRPEHELLRIATCERGEVAVHTRCSLRPDFGQTRACITDAAAIGIRYEAGGSLYTLRGDAPLAIGDDGVARSSFVLRAGESAAFSLTFDREAPAVLPPLGVHAGARVEETVLAWRAWLARATMPLDHRAVFERSLLALKLLDYAPSGAIIAAPTTSLPERIGGDLNWDYRFCWVRDSAFTATAMLSAGLIDEARSFCGWLLHATRLTRPSLRVLYDVFGGVPSRERELRGLAGYLGSRPVRVRNLAAGQSQIDCYGEVLDATEQMHPPGEVIDLDTQRMLADFGRYVIEHWREPDQGIWEERGPARHHTYSKVMCWVALDRSLRLGRDGRAPRLRLAEIATARDAIRADVIAHGFDATLGSYVDSYGSRAVDTSLLLLAWHGFEDPRGPRMQGTYRRIRDRLRAGPGLYYRFEHSYALGEGAFALSSFWIVCFLALGGGSLADARRELDAALRYANDVDLFAEEIDPRTGDALGNFPQGYSHVGVINAIAAVVSRAERERAAEAA